METTGVHKCEWEGSKLLVRIGIIDDNREKKLFQRLWKNGNSYIRSTYGCSDAQSLGDWRIAICHNYVRVGESQYVSEKAFMIRMENSASYISWRLFFEMNKALNFSVLGRFQNMGLMHSFHDSSKSGQNVIKVPAKLGNFWWEQIFLENTHYMGYPLERNCGAIRFPICFHEFNWTNSWNWVCSHWPTFSGKGNLA